MIALDLIVGFTFLFGFVYALLLLGAAAFKMFGYLVSRDDKNGSFNGAINFLRFALFDKKSAHISQSKLLMASFVISIVGVICAVFFR